MFLLALGATAAIAAERVVFEAPNDEIPTASDTEPRPGDPPLVWVEGALEELDESQLVVREGEGESLTLERLAAGATTFLRSDGESWRELATEETGALDAGGDVCVEALLDGRTLLALRVFLGSQCGPSGSA